MEQPAEPWIRPAEIWSRRADIWMDLKLGPETWSKHAEIECMPAETRRRVSETMGRPAII